jgi:hypothetical protein
LPHVLPRADLARVLAPTYAKAAQVDEEEAEDRLQRALAIQRVADELYGGIATALEDARGPRTERGGGARRAQHSVDAELDKLSAGLQKRRSRVRAAELTPAVSAVLVSINLELGHAPEMMREALRGEKGAALLRDGVRAVGAHLVRELMK